MLLWFLCLFVFIWTRKWSFREGPIDLCVKSVSRTIEERKTLRNGQRWWTLDIAFAILILKMRFCAVLRTILFFFTASSSCFFWGFFSPSPSLIPLFYSTFMCVYKWDETFFGELNLIFTSWYDNKCWFRWFSFSLISSNFKESNK